MAYQSRLAGTAGFLAAISMAITPASAQAAEVAPAGTLGYATGYLAQGPGVSGSPFDSSSYDAEAETSEWRDRRYGWRRGWRRHRRGIDGGDVLAGVLILGGIAAIASAASNKNERRERERYDDRRYDDRRYDDRRYDDRRATNPRASGGSGIDNAVDMCLAEIERDVRVDTVDGASRTASGWLVTGSLFNGSGFTCAIDNSGRISNIDYGGFSGIGSYDNGGAPAAGQLTDDRYADARARVGMQNYVVGEATTEFAYNDAPAVSEGPLPAYPGGPLPGEE